MQLMRDIAINSFKGLQFVTLKDCGRVNALIGKNNSGKSSILHAIDMAGLALGVGNWNSFQPKLNIKDLFADVGAFSIDVTYADDSTIRIAANPNCGSTISIAPADNQKFKTILIWPDVSAGMRDRRHRTPLSIMQQIENRNFQEVDSLEMLFAIRFYAFRNERGFSPEIYQELLGEIKNYFPDIDDLQSERTEQDIATLTYSEYGRDLDILYSGSGMKHFLDILLKTTVSEADVVLLDEPEMGLHPDLQRRFIEYLQQLTEKKGVQVFMATHSPVLLSYADSMTHFRILNSRGKRSVIRVPKDAVYTVLSDLGIRPSDLFNQDICLLVEGASDVVFFEHVIRNLYADEFQKVSVGVLQYGGGAADGIVSGSIDVSNIVPAQEYTYWIRDRDAAPTSQPLAESTRFKDALAASNLKCHIWQKREIEFYYPREILIAAQQGDTEKEDAIVEILGGDQEEKFKKAASEQNLCVPRGKLLRQLLRDHVTKKSQIDQDVKDIVEKILIPWKRELLGE